MTTKLTIVIERDTIDPKKCGMCVFYGSHEDFDHRRQEWCQNTAFGFVDGNGKWDDEHLPVTDGERLPQCLAAEHEAGKASRVYKFLQDVGDDWTSAELSTPVAAILDEEAPQ